MAPLRPRDSDVEATVFWLIVSALIIAFTSFPIRDAIAASGLVVAVIFLLDGYYAWRGKRWAFILSIALALFTVVGAFALDFSSTSGGSPFLFMSQQAYLVIPETLLIFYALRAYRNAGIRSE